MSDYTPTTEEVRIKYRLSSGRQPGDFAEFDRWLAAHDAEVRAEWGAEQGDYYEGFEEGVKVGRDGLGPRPITDEMLGIMAQAFFEATHFPGSGIRYMAMTVKPEIVAGLRAALEAAEEARR